MGNNSSRGYESSRRHHQPPYYSAPGWSSSTRGRMKGHHPAAFAPPPPPPEEYDDYDYDADPRHRPRRQHTFPEPQYQEEYYESPSFSATPGHIPFPPVQSGYVPPVIPNAPHSSLRARGHTYPAPTPAVQMPVPNPAPPPVIPHQHQHHQHQPVIPPPPVIPQMSHGQATNIPYPGSDAPVIPPGQTVIFPSGVNVATSSAGHEPAMQMPEPNVQGQQAPYSVSPERLAPGQYGPHDGGRQTPRRSPEHRRTRSHNHHSDDYYDRPRHRHSVDSAQYYRRRRQESPLRNPLPSPPKDVFERPDLAELLTQLRLPPEESTLRRDPNAPTHALVIPHNGPARVERVITRPSHQPHSSEHVRERSTGEKKKSGGLFRSLSNKLKPKHRDSRHYHHDRGGIPIQELFRTQPLVITAEEQMLPPPVPPFTPPPPVVGSDTGQSQAPVPPPGQFGPPSGTPGMPMRMPSPNPSTRQGPPASPSRSPRPPPLPPVLKIDNSNQYASLLHFSPHPVHFMEKLYPTAYHLYEAMKFMGDNPRHDIIDHIRASGPGQEGINRAGDASRQFADQMRGDWDQVMVSMMEDALYEKFVQHESVRRLLLSTGESGLVFADPEDNFWGDGSVGRGLNEIGKILMRIRTRLVDAGFS